MDNFVEIHNDSDSKWSYICTAMLLGYYAGDAATSKGTLDSGGRVRNYERNIVWPGMIYLCRGTYPPEHCIRNPDMKRDYNAMHKPTFRITGNADAGYKLESDCYVQIRECFVSTADQHQQHSSDQQQGNDRNVEEQPQEKALRKHLVELCNRMHSAEVIIYLFSKGCMSPPKKDEIESERETYKRNDRLVTWLRSQPISTFKIFCEALDSSNQHHLSTPLRDYI